MSHSNAGHRPPYPSYPSTRITGCLPPAPINTENTRPWARNPFYTQYAGARGRQLSGVDMDHAEPTRDYANELDTLQVADDVVGNGVFDPAGSAGNVHRDAGVFADHQGLPGYLARERFYQESEVLDVTTGLPVVYVPGGAVPVDEAQVRALQMRRLWELPPTTAARGNRLGFEPTVIPREASWPLGAVEEGSASLTKMFIVSSVAGLSLGMLLALALKK